ncbi:MAG: hypothetical protein ABFR32_02520 [Bacteroidota bacterium]
MKKVGIWLDQKEANIITINDDKHELKSIYSEIETRERFPGESKQFGRFGEQYINDEKSKKLRIEDQTNRYLNDIYSEIRNAEEILIFGPAQTKIKLEKLIHKKPKLVSKLKDVLNSDKMTENQKVAYVKKYFK